MTLIVGTRAAQLVYCDTMLKPEERQHIRDITNEPLSFALEELRLGYLDNWFLQRPRRCDPGYGSYTLVRVGDLAKDIVPNCTFRCSSSMAASASRDSMEAYGMQAGIECEPMLTDGEETLVEKDPEDDGLEEAVVDTMFRKYTCEMAPIDVLINARAKGYVGVPIRHGRDQAVIMRVVEARRNCSSGSVARVHPDGSMELWIRVRCRVLPIRAAEGEKLTCRITSITSEKYAASFGNEPETENDLLIRSVERRMRVGARGVPVHNGGQDVPNVLVLIEERPDALLVQDKTVDVHVLGVHARENPKSFDDLNPDSVMLVVEATTIPDTP